MKYFKHITTKDLLTGADLSEKRIMYYRPEFSETVVICIPHEPGNDHFDEMVAEVDAGTSEIVEVDSTSE